MSVFTTVEQDERFEFLRHYRAGEPLCFENISDGTENTGYFVATSRQRADHSQPLTG
jgi:hypothetical protein